MIFSILLLLAGAVLVANGRVEKVHAQLQPPLDDFPGGSLVQGSAVLAGGGVAKAHAPHADAGHVQIGIAKFCVLHCAHLVV